MSEPEHVVEKESGSKMASAYTELMLVYVQRSFHVCSLSAFQDELFAVPAGDEIEWTGKREQIPTTIRSSCFSSFSAEAEACRRGEPQQ